MPNKHDATCSDRMQAGSYWEGEQGAETGRKEFREGNRNRLTTNVHGQDRGKCFGEGAGDVTRSLPTSVFLRRVQGTGSVKPSGVDATILRDREGSGNRGGVTC